MKTIPKKWIYLISITIITLLIAVVVGSHYTNYDNSDEISPENGPGKGMGGHWTQNYTLLAASAAIIAVIVLMSYYFMSRKVDKHLEENMKLISQIVNTNSNDDQSKTKNVENSYRTVLLKFLNYNENKVLKRIIEHNGTILQSEISRMPGIGKVKAHRILKDMKIKGIISVEKYGKTNRVNLSKDVKKLFLE